MTMYYAGIGSRETPKVVCDMMYKIGAAHADLGLTLRSGGAIGADIAFERGCDSIDSTLKQIFYATNNKGVIVPEYIMQQGLVFAWLWLTVYLSITYIIKVILQPYAHIIAI